MKGGDHHITAKTEEAKIIMLPKNMKRNNWKVEEIHKFFCPQCKETVQLKVGEIVVPHFAHLKDDILSAYFPKVNPGHLEWKATIVPMLSAETYPRMLNLEPYFKDLHSVRSTCDTGKRANIRLNSNAVRFPFPT